MVDHSVVAVATITFFVVNCDGCYYYSHFESEV